MKNLSLWLFSALAGLLFIFLLNTSPISRMGFGIDLPIAWQSPPAENYNKCTPEQQFTDPVSNRCQPVCTDMRYPDKGLPFSNTRQGRVSRCSIDTNTLATFLNVFTGIGAGLLYSFIVQKRWPK